jgi:hypothetical protein
LKFSSLSQKGAEVLSGQLPDSWNVKDPNLIAFLSSFAIPDAVKSAPPITTTITEDDFIYSIKGWKESTSTSGRHLGHYKALIHDPTLLTFYVLFLNTLVSNGMALERWQNAVNVLIEKDPDGEPKLNRLRIIHLFEADYNFVLKLLWGSRLVKHGETSANSTTTNTDHDAVARASIQSTSNSSAWISAEYSNSTSRVSTMTQAPATTASSSL